MAQDKRIFTGGLDKDIDSRLIKNGDYRHALNIRNVSSADGTSGVIENVKGNSEVVYNGFLNSTNSQTQINQVTFSGVEVENSSEVVSFTVTVGVDSYTANLSWQQLQAGPGLFTYLSSFSFPSTIGTHSFSFLVPDEPPYVSGSTSISIVGPVGVEFTVSVDNSSSNNISISTTQSQNSATASDYVCIGAFEDSPTNSIYYFIHDKYGIDDCILEYNQMTDTILPVYHDRGTDKILKFSDLNLITGVDKIDDLLYWTDDKERPRKVNVRLAKANEQNILNAITYTDNNFVSGNTKLIGLSSDDFIVGNSVWIQQNSPAPISSIDGYSEITAVVAGEMTLDLPWQGSSPAAPGIVLNPSPEEAYSPLISFGSYEEKIKYFDAVKHQPKNKPTYEFFSDANHGKNNIIGSVWQFRYRNHHVDDEYSKYSPISNIVISDAYASNNILPEYELSFTDNSLKVSYKNTISDVSKIEIVARKGNDGEFFLVDTIDNDFISFLKDRRDNSISGSIYNLGIPKVDFNNSGIYTFIDFTETDNNNDEVPLKAKAQAIMSNNRLAYGNILSGRDNVDIDVNLTPKYGAAPLSNQSTTIPNLTPTFTFSGNGSSKFEIYYTLSTVGIDFTKHNTVFIHVKYKYTASSLVSSNLLRKAEFVMSYTVPQSINSNEELAIAVKNYLNSSVEVSGNQGPELNAIITSGSTIKVTINHADSSWVLIPSINSFTETFTSKILVGELSTNSFKSGAFHDFGIVYSDETNRVSYVSTSKDSKTYVKFPTERDVIGDAAIFESSEGYGAAEIDWTISHKPPAWATSYQWVYSGNTSLDEFIQISSNKTVVNTSTLEDSRIFFSLNSLKGEEYSYNSIHSSLVDYTFAEGDRIRFISYINSSSERKFFDGHYDFEISSYDLYSDSDEDPISEEGYWISIEDPSLTDSIDEDGVVVPINGDNLESFEGIIFELYRPSKSIGENDLTFFEIGDKYEILNPGTESRSHAGPTLNQGTVITAPNGNTISIDFAKGTFSEGDIYIKPRNMSVDLAPVLSETFYPEDYYLNDFYDTNHYSKGRPNIINEFSKERRLGSTVIYSGAYSSIGAINYLNNFNLSAIPYMDYNKGYGSIQRLESRNDDLIMFQENKVSRVLVGKNLLTAADGAETVALSNQILSTQSAYAGDYGVSLNPESLSQYGNTFYFCDIKRGAILRLSADGLTVISNYGLKDYTRDRGDLYVGVNNEEGEVGSNYRIRGGYDPTYDEYVVSLPSVFSTAGETWDTISTNWDAITSNWEALSLTIQSEAETLGFNEETNRWVSLYSFAPEFSSKVNNQFITFKGGKLYKHDINPSYCNFYGVQYGVKLDAVFNAEPSSIKRYKALGIEGDTPMDISISTDINSSDIKAVDFVSKEGIKYASIPFGTSTTSSGGEVIGLGFIDSTVSEGFHGITPVGGYDISRVNTPKNLLTIQSKAVVGASYVIFLQDDPFNFNDIAEETLVGNGSTGDEFTCNATTTDTTIGNSIVPQEYLVCIDDVGTEKILGYLAFVNPLALSCVISSVSTQLTSFSNKFAYIKRVDTLEGDPIKGQYMEADLSLSSTPNKLRLFALDAQVVKSELSNK